MGRTVSGIFNALSTRCRLLSVKLGGYKIQCRGIQHFAPSVELKFDKGANISLGMEYISGKLFFEDSEKYNVQIRRWGYA